MNDSRIGGSLLTTKLAITVGWKEHLPGVTVEPGWKKIKDFTPNEMMSMRASMKHFQSFLFATFPMYTSTSRFHRLFIDDVQQG